MKLKQNKSVETTVLNQTEEEILKRKKCRQSRFDLEELGAGKEAELCTVFKEVSITYPYW